MIIFVDFINKRLQVAHHTPAHNGALLEIVIEHLAHELLRLCCSITGAEVEVAAGGIGEEGPAQPEIIGRKVAETEEEGEADKEKEKKK